MSNTQLCRVFITEHSQLCSYMYNILSCGCLWLCRGGLVASLAALPKHVDEKANREEVEYFNDAKNTAAQEEPTGATDRN